LDQGQADSAASDLISSSARYSYKIVQYKLTIIIIIIIIIIILLYPWDTPKG